MNRKHITRQAATKDGDSKDAAVRKSDVRDMHSAHNALQASNRQSEVKLEVPPEAVPPMSPLRASRSHRVSGDVPTASSGAASPFASEATMQSTSNDKEGLRIAAERGATLALIGSRPSGISKVTVSRVGVGSSVSATVMHVDTSDILAAPDAGDTTGTSRAQQLY